MITVNNELVKINSFPDGTTLMKYGKTFGSTAHIEWFFENEREFVQLIYLAKHLRRLRYPRVTLYMPYIPNARMDRVKNSEDVFTLKYFVEVLNSMEFDEVAVLDPHSSVSEALINNLRIITPKDYINEAISSICSTRLLMFYPDSGSQKRYSEHIKCPYAFGIKRRNWETGEIEGLDIAGAVDKIKGKDILIVDDICSRGGTFLHSAKKLKELGANDIYIYVSHCENTILEGDLLKGDLIKTVFTTNSIFTKEHEKIVIL